MKIHDWRRVGAGIFHDFHTTWLSHIKESLNAGILPEGFYALAEQQTGAFGPDVVALHLGFQDLSGSPPYDPPADSDTDREGGMVALAEAPPQVQLAVEAGEETEYYFAKRRSVVIRHSSDDRVVAIIEIVSPANKHSPERVHEFCEKVVTALKEGVHVLIIDLLSNTKAATDGMHGAIWEELLAGDYTAPAESPLALASYCAKRPVKAFVEPTAVGRELIDMPLFLTPTHYVSVPLAATYQQAYFGVPHRWQSVIELRPAN
jgi:hypothetical protein